MMMITLMQCIKQARWPEDGPLATLPGVEVELERRRIEEGNGNASPRNLAELTIMSRPDLESVMRLVEVPGTSQASVNPLPVCQYIAYWIFLVPSHCRRSPSDRD